jgi:hypothetical protein
MVSVAFECAGDDELVVDSEPPRETARLARKMPRERRRTPAPIMRLAIGRAFMGIS